MALPSRGCSPTRSRARAATALAGAVCTVAGVFPYFAMSLPNSVGLYGTILAPALLLWRSLAGTSGGISEELVKGAMLLGTVLWFAAAPQWLKAEKPA